MKRQLLAVGIVTNNRRDTLLRLLSELYEQAGTRLDVIINENGSNAITKDDLKVFVRLRITLLKQQETGIPRARNILLQRVKNRYQWLVFIDDDCLPAKNWLATIHNFFIRPTANSFWAIQGVSRSIPLGSPYANASGLLYKLWFDANTVGSASAILDTKCCALNMRSMETSGLLFDETIRYASDVDLGCRINRFNKKNKIHILRQWSVFHEERQNFVQFVSHRTRLSMAYRLIKNRYPGDLSSVHWGIKLRAFWNIKMPIQDKTKILIALALSRAFVATGLWTE